MKKNLILAVSVLFLLLVETTLVFAAEVSQSRAQAVAQNWLQHARSDVSLTGNIEYKITVEEPIVYNYKTVGYNFILSPSGHIIVPSRDELPVVKLYSFNTSLSMLENSDVAQWIGEELAMLNEALDSHTAEMADVDHSKTKNGLLWALFDKDSTSFSLDSAPSLASAGTVAIGPLLTTAWSQEDPYNLHTPLWFDGQPTVTGCVATAAAQIMKYWNYPANGQGSTSYAWNDGSASQTLAANFASSTYNWNAMTDSYGQQSSTLQREAVAQLMSDVGIAFHMNYGKSANNGSSAYLAAGSTAFPSYFGYKSSISLVNRTSYASDSAWMQIFKNEVQNGRPIEFAIRATTNNAGHAIVVDGYRDSPTEQIHLNLGWAGAYDGWYVSNNIVTGSYSWTVVNGQQALIGIEPSGTATPPAITTKEATSVSAASATLNGTATPNGVPLSAYFQFGTSTAYGSVTNPLDLGSGRSAIPVTADLNGLSCGGSTYHFRAVGVTGSGTSYYGTDATFTTGPCTQSKPIVATTAATGIGQASATLNGTVNPNGAITTAYFQLGPTTSYGSVTSPSDPISGNVSINSTLSGLVCGGTTYHYRAVGTNSGGTSYGADVSFTTGACTQAPPAVTTHSASNIGQTGAILNGTVNPKGASTTAYFQYGANIGYGGTTANLGMGSGSSAQAITAAINGLTCGGATYHYRVVGSNSGGPSYGSDMTFSTAACPDLIPNPFSFIPQTNVALNTTETSNLVTISGIAAPSPISITAGGSYSINGAAFTSAAGTVNNGEMVKVRVTSSLSYATSTSATLTVGGVPGTFSVTTVPVAGSMTNLVLNQISSPAKPDGPSTAVAVTTLQPTVRTWATTEAVGSPFSGAITVSMNISIRM